MHHIVLTEEQAQVVTQAEGPVEVRHPDGRTLASLTPLEPGDIDAIRRAKQSLAAGGPRIPSEHVQAFLRSLDEAHQHEGIDAAQVESLLSRVLAGEPT